MDGRVKPDHDWEAIFRVRWQFSESFTLLSGNACSKGGCGAFRVDGDDPQVSAGGLVRLTAALFPIAQSAKRNMVTDRKFFLRQLQGPTDDHGVWHYFRRGNLVCTERSLSAAL